MPNPKRLLDALYGGAKAAKAAPKPATASLSAQERQENLAKFLSDSKIKERLYHATPGNFKEFKPGGKDPTLSGPAIWLSTDAKYQPAMHNISAGEGKFREGVNVMPVHVQAKNPLVLDDPVMIDWAREVFAGGSREFPELLPPKWVEEVRKEGYDSIMFADPFGKGQTHEVIMFEPNKIKSALGNEGTYDTSTPDITKAAGGAVSMQVGGSPLDRFMGKTPKRGVSSLPGYGQGNILQDIETVAPRLAGGIDAALTGLPIAGRTLVSPAVTAGTFIKEAMKSGDPSDTSPLQRALEASQEFITGDMRPMQTELGPEYLESTAEGLERLLRESKLPPILPQLWTTAAMPGALGAVKDVAKTTTKANIPEVSAPKAATIPAQGVTYETTTEGPFYRVRPSVSQAPAGERRGSLESDGLEARQRPAGGTGSDVPQPITDETVRQVMSDPTNFVRQSADTYVQEAFGRPYQLPEISESSILKQAPIGRAFMLATTEDPAYKQTIFDQYASQMPEVIQQSGAKNYDELLAASYRQLAKETDEQFKRLPINLSYHRAGEGNYRNSKQMLQDVYGNKHLYVFQGGDEHPYLKEVDPATGLNENEKFRAVHDFFGHAIHGNEFGPKGEETAWAAHSQMYSPLAQLAMSAETRGQNSTVNYTPLNAALKRTINELNMQRYEANRRGKTDLVKEIDGQLKEAWNGFQFAPQKPVLLPPEFISTKYEGEMPDYLRSLIRPEEGTSVSMPMTHFSKQAGLTETDPSFYGTGIKGEEAARLGEKGSVRPRTYFYTDESVTPEPGLGSHRYRAMGENLYDLAADPLMLSMLARETTRIPMTASSNKGLAQPAEATNALERLIRDYGYAGYISPQSTKPSAVLFGKVPVTPYKQGGAMKRVHISDNPDTMLLELMRNKRYG